MVVGPSANSAATASVCAVSGMAEQVDVDSFQPLGPGDGDEVADRTRGRRPSVQDISKADIALQAALAQSFDGDTRAGVNGGGGQEIAGVARIRLNGVIGRRHIRPAG